MSYYLNQIPIMLMALPVILISLSVHEASHGYAAYKLGDPTAKNLGRLTLNPMKHINLYGFIAMLFFRVGWANPVPIRARNFKNPRKGMAISAAAGPASNLCLAIIFTILLRLTLIPLQSMADGLYYVHGNKYWISEELSSNMLFTILSVLVVMLVLGIGINLNLMFFNMIPIPPFDGSRVLFTFLPTDLYFKVMRYEKYFMYAFIFLLATGIVSLPLSVLTDGVTNAFYTATGMPEDLLTVVYSNLLNRLPKFSL